MANKRSVQRISSKKRSRPKVRFNFGVLIIIFALSFAACFVLYMIAANINDDFFDDESEKIVVQEQTSSGNDEDSASDENAGDGSTSSKAPTAVNPIPQSAAADASYLDSSCLITDSTLLEMSGYTEMDDVTGNAQLNAVNCNESKVETPYGTVTVYEMLQLKKPVNAYFMLGSDIGTSTVDEMIASYTTLISNLHGYLPEMHIYVMQLPPVISDTETLTNAKINEYNSRLLEMANNLGVYCIDTNTALKSADGTLSEEYWNAEALTLNEAAYKAICGYILTHTV